MTPQRNAQLHKLLTDTNLMSQKASLILGHTDGRTESSKEMTDFEANELIKYLRSLTTNTTDAANKMRRKIIAMCHRIQWTRANGGVDMVRLNNWCLTKSYLKKNLNDYTYNELPKLVSEFQQVYKYYISKS